MAAHVRRSGTGIEKVTPRFRPTHLAFSWTGQKGSGVRYRVVDELGMATHWRRVPESHDMEYGDHHFSGVQTVDRPVTIEWYPEAPPGRQMGPVTLDYMNTEDGPLVTHEIPATADAKASVPHIVTRAEWNADESLKDANGGCTRQFFPVQQLFVHHTAGSNNDSDPAATMRAIYYYHVHDRGWCDIGYNFVIARNGTIFEGRWARDYKPWETHDSEDEMGNAVVGAHVEGFNSGSVGTSLMGNYQTAKLPAPARASLVDLLAWEADRHNLAPTGTHTYKNPDTGTKKVLPYIAGHRDAGQTDCPGDTVYKDLPNIRQDVADLIGRGKPNVKLSFVPPEQSLKIGHRATVTGLLRTHSGTPLGKHPVRLFTRAPGEKWKRKPDITTKGDGSFSFLARPPANLQVAVQYHGDDATWPTKSKFARVLIRPQVTLRPVAPASVGGRGVAHYAPGTDSVGIAGSVLPAHPGLRLMVRVQKVRADGSTVLVTKLGPRLGRKSRYHARFEGPQDGKRYRVIAWFRGDEDHERSPSDPIYLQVDP
jgi:hypothetical protein